MHSLFLLADDDNDDAELFAEALEDVAPDMLFKRVENGQLALDFLSDPSNPSPCLLFLDLNMPEMSGWQCLSLLKSSDTYRHIPVIMYTTSAYSRDREIAEDLGAAGLITKPNNFNTLKQIMALLVTHSGDSLQSALATIEKMAEKDSY